jgi:hypothetical protein
VIFEWSQKFDTDTAIEVWKLFKFGIPKVPFSLKDDSLICGALGAIAGLGAYWVTRRVVPFVVGGAYSGIRSCFPKKVFKKIESLKK